MSTAGPAPAPLLRLLLHHLDDLRRSGLTDETIRRWGCYSIEADQKWVMSQLGFPHLTPPALALPVLTLELAEPNRNFCIIKPDRPRSDKRGRQVKYESPKNFANRLHVPLSVRDKISDASVILVITEGQKKAEAGAQGRICVVGLFGVNNWLSRVGESSFPIGDFDSIPLKDRRVILCFDSDAAEKAGVRRAERDLAQFLRKRGAQVLIKRLPPGLDGQKVGLDDLLVKNSVEQFWALPEETPQFEPSVESLIEELVPGSPKKQRERIFQLIASEDDPGQREHLLKQMSKRLEISLAAVKASFKPCLEIARQASQFKAASATGDEDGADAVDPGPYRIEKGCISVERLRDCGLVRTPLCNFTAKVTEEMVLDDGQESMQVFVVEGQLGSGEMLPPIRVPVDRFASMAWVMGWGLKAIISAGTVARDQLREAIQRFSPKPKIRHLYTHTGWRRTDSGQWLFLTAAGAFGDEGGQVDVGPDLQRYRLPTCAEDPLQAMRMSLRLLEVAPLTVTVPLWAAMYRAPLCSALRIDLSIWIVGPTGSLKSTVAALFLSHFGEFTRLDLPGSWSSTANALERRAFVLKDLPFVVDDFAPSARDSYELHQKAERLLRAQGNLAGRGRLRADLTERPTHVPRGLIISTGEDQPAGGTGSVLARTLLIELSHSMIDVDGLTQAQKTIDRLPHAMGGYIAWLAPQMDRLRVELREGFERARSMFTRGSQHLRQPEALAHLWLGVDFGLAFAEQVGALSVNEAEILRERCSEALQMLGQEQGLRFEAERPMRRFLEILHTLLMQRRVCLLDRSFPSAEPTAQVPLIGWFDERSVYLISDAAYQAVCRFCREAGESFPITQHTLLRDLNRAGLSVCATGRNTTMVRVGDHHRRVLQLGLKVLKGFLQVDFSAVLPKSRPLGPDDDA